MFCRRIMIRPMLTFLLIVIQRLHCIWYLAPPGEPMWMRVCIQHYTIVARLAPHNHVSGQRNWLSSSVSTSGAHSMGHRGHVPPPLQMAGHGGTVSRRTANKKLTKL